jgi:hypothetical protein
MVCRQLSDEAAQAAADYEGGVMGDSSGLILGGRFLPSVPIQASEGGDPVDFSYYSQDVLDGFAGEAPLERLRRLHRSSV